MKSSPGPTVIKSNTVGSAAPGATDDSPAGYAVSSLWIDTTNDKADVCLGSTATAAVWTEISQGGGGGSDISARVYTTANQSIANATWTAINFGGEDYDTDTIHDNSTNNSRFTCKTSGKYVILGYFTFVPNSTGRRVVQIRENGDSLPGGPGQMQVEPVVGNPTHYICSVYWTLP